MGNKSIAAKIAAIFTSQRQYVRNPPFIGRYDLIRDRVL